MTYWRTRRSVAGALAGEIGAYYRLLSTNDLAGGLRTHATAPRADRRDWARSLPATPTGHPVFDKMSDRIGMLSSQNAQRISEVYNLVTSMRILLAGFTLPGFIDASDRMQAARLAITADLLDKEILRFPGTIARLDTASRLLPVRPWRWINKKDGRQLDPKVEFSSSIAARAPDPHHPAPPAGQVVR
jgi:hypothetical protein